MLLLLLLRNHSVYSEQMLYISSKGTMILLIAGVDILFVRKNIKFNLDDAVF